MIQRINDNISKHNTGKTSCNNIYIIDHKKINGGDVELFCQDQVHKSVLIVNERPIEIFYDLFLDNALVISPGLHSKQCECVLFPTTLENDDWILFIETKYANDLKAAFSEKADYPNCMVTQAIECVKFFRDKGIIEAERKVHAILSFPTLIDDFSESFFSRCDKTVEEILKDHKILIRPSNSITVKSNKRLKM